MTAGEIVVWIHLLSTWFMIGLVWFVQCVHYPLLRDLPPEIVPTYQKAHVRRTSPMIPIVMIGEAVSGLMLVFPAFSAIAIANLGLLVGVWLTTFALIVPVHGRLCRQHETALVTRLLRLNLLRSLLWLAHGFTALAMVLAK